jgi:predicted RNA-binding Zn-ribbon protein involved in translation (DUF1610 family)
MEFKKYKDKEWLRKQLNQGRTLKSIANEFKVSKRTIAYWRDKYELAGDKKTKLECSNCGDIFKRLNFSDTDVHFCSINCESEYKEDKKELICVNCGDIVKRIPSQVTSEKYYCDKECRHEHQRGKNHPRYSTINIDCEYCEESFKRTPSQLAKNKNYCSEECYHLDVKTDRDKNSHEYKRWRNEVRERDGWECQDCGWAGDRIEAHHIESWSGNPEKRFQLDNGKSLCIECHYLTHIEKEEWHSAGLVKGRVDMDRLQEMERYEKVNGV